MKDEQAIVLYLVPMPSDVPVARRLRALLKRALRDWGLKCTHVGHREPQPVAVKPKPKRTS